MRLPSDSTAPLLPLSVLVIGCSWVDPSECWVNTSGGFGGGGTIPIGNAVGASSGDFASPPRSGPLDYGGKSNPCMTPDSPPKRSGGTGTPQSPEGDNPFAGIAPDVLAKASLKSSAFAYYLDAMLTSSMVDPDDPAALAAAFERDAPTAEREVDAWLGTIDASTLATATGLPRYDCTEKYGCPYSVKCYNSGPWSSESYACWVSDCDDAKCRACPDWVPPMLKHLIFASWCAYECTTQNPPRKLVAEGAVWITPGGRMLPKADRAWCIKR